MKLFIVGSDKIYAIENFYVRYLREKGIAVFHFLAQNYFYDYYQRNLLNKLIFKSGFSGIHKDINEKFKSEVLLFKPDVIWVFKGMELFPKTLLWAKRHGIKLVNFNADNPLVFSGKGSGNKNVTDAIPIYDLHLTYDAIVRRQLEAKWTIPVGILPFGFDIDAEIYEKCAREPELLKACFLGNPDQCRGAFLQKLAENGIRMDVYGNAWSKFVQHPNISIFEPVYGDEFWLVLRKYRVQLNLMRPHNPDTHNMRTFEVPGIGGILLAPATEDHQVYFKPEEEIFIYTDLLDCIAQIQKIIAFTKEDANRVRTNARSRSILSGYQYKDRATLALELINSVIE
jgi:spore maturation protein CgeB